MTDDSQRSPRFRFSLASFLLASALVCVSVSHLITSRQLARTRDALTVAHNELGILSIDDPDRVHALSLPAPNRSQWRWRIQLPDSQKFRLCYLVGSIPPTGLPDDRSSAGSSTSILTDRNGQISEPFILNAALAKDELGDWKLKFATHAVSILPKIENPPDWLDMKPRPSITWVAGRSSTEDGASKEPYVLLRYYKSKSNPTDGIVVWIEPDE